MDSPLSKSGRLSWTFEHGGLTSFETSVLQQAHSVDVLRMGVTWFKIWFEVGMTLKCYSPSMIIFNRGWSRPLKSTDRDRKLPNNPVKEFAVDWVEHGILASALQQGSSCLTRRLQ